MIDTNKDGYVSLAELEAFVNHYLAQMDDNCSFGTAEEVLLVKFFLRICSPVLLTLERTLILSNFSAKI